MPEESSGQRDRQLLVAIHDVTPAHQERLERVFDLLTECRVERYALLVVPDWHGEWPLRDHPRFAADLRSRHAAGAEMFLHGFRHDEVGSRRTIRQELVAAGRTTGEGEFLVLSPQEAARRIDLGREVLEGCGLRPVGFVPPAWLHGRNLGRILAQRNLAITEGFFRITDTKTRRHLHAPALSWSTRKPWRSVACAGLAAARCRIEARRRIIRVAIHPPDIDGPTVARSLRRTLGELLVNRVAITYRRALSLP